MSESIHQQSAELRIAYYRAEVAEARVYRAACARVADDHPDWTTPADQFRIQTAAYEDPEYRQAATAKEDAYIKMWRLDADLADHRDYLASLPKLTISNAPMEITEDAAPRILAAIDSQITRAPRKGAK